MPVLELSDNTRRWRADPRPRWRGVSHRVAAVGSVGAGTWLVLQAASPVSRVVVAVFAVSILAMFTVSAVAHRRRWPARVTEVLVRLDHTTIYLAIAGSATPVAVLGLDGWPQLVLLVWTWGFAIVGMAVEWLPFAPGRGFSNSMYLSMSWPTVVLLPWLVASAGWGTVAWLVAGGVLYTVGAVIVAIRRPDPAPRVFGYHEIWHLMVIGAVAAHYVMVWTLL